MEPGFYAPVHFDQLMLLDTWTPDGRRIEAAGFGTRNMPRPIFLMDTQSEGGHLGSKIAGRLDSVTVEGKVVSGDGWLLDNQTGRDAAMYLETKCITGNSVDLADVSAEMVPFTPDGSEEERIGVTFTKANIGATTLVGIPAFPDATAAKVDLSELSAIGAFSTTSFKVASPSTPTLHTTDVPLDWFTGEEGKRGAYPLTVESNGRVHGYLADWKTLHLSVAGRVRAPRGSGYSHFNASTVLTPQGPVATGPLVIGGEHASMSQRWTEAIDHYAATSLAWADVHVRDDRWGIRVNGMVRPGTPAEAVHAGRASRLSGDWRRIGAKMELIAALSVNSPGFPIGRSFAAEDGTGALVLFAPEKFAQEADPAELAKLRARIMRSRLAGI